MISRLLIKFIKVYQNFSVRSWDKTVDFIQRVLNMQWKLCRFTVSLGGIFILKKNIKMQPLGRLWIDNVPGRDKHGCN